MTWQVLAAISVLSLSIANLLQRVLMREEDSEPIGTAIVFQFLLGFMGLVSALIFHRFIWSTAIIFSFPFLFSAILWAMSTVFTFKAVKLIGAGENTIFSTISTVITIILGVVLFHEVFTGQTILGSFLILFSVILVAYDHLSFSSGKGMVFAVIASIASSIAVVNDIAILKHYEAFSYMAMMSIAPGVLLACIFPQHVLRVWSKEFIGRLHTVGIFTLLYTIQGISYYLAFKYGALISHMSPISKTTVIMTVILSAIFLGERKKLPSKLLAAVLTLVGVLLIQ